MRMQQPDSTVLSEPSFKDKSSFSCDTSSLMSSNCSVSMDSKNPLQIRRSSAFSMEYDTDHSDSIINVKPLHSEHSRATHMESESIGDSPNPYIDCSKKSSTDLNGSDLFFSTEKSETSAVQSKSKTSAVYNKEPDDFYDDDFDIDDFNDSDIPDYFDKTPTAPQQNSRTVTTTVKEGGPSKSTWERKPTTPVSAPKPSKISSPGKSVQRGIIWACTLS